MEELLRKIDNHENLSLQDYWEMIDNYSIYSDEGEDGRWTRFMYNLIKLGDRYFEINWQKDLTEMQEDCFDYYPEEVEFYGYEEVVVKRKCPIIKRKYDDKLIML